MRRISVLVLLFASIAAVAQPTCDQLVPQAMEVSGLNQALAVTPELMRQMAVSQFDQEGSMPVEAKQQLIAVLSHGFDADRLAKNIRTKLNASCDAAVFADAVQQLQSPLGAKMLAMELHPVTSPEEAKRMQRYVASFSMQSPRESRMALIHQLMDVTKAAENYNDQMVNVTVAMVETALNSAPSKEQLAEFRKEMLPRVQQMMEAQMYYTYRTASDEELQQYITMQSSKSLQRLTDTEAKALLYAFSLEATDMASQIRKIVVEQRAKHGGE